MEVIDIIDLNSIYNRMINMPKHERLLKVLAVYHKTLKEAIELQLPSASSEVKEMVYWIEQLHLNPVEQTLTSEDKTELLNLIVDIAEHYKVVARDVFLAKGTEIEKMLETTMDSKFKFQFYLASGVASKAIMEEARTSLIGEPAYPGDKCLARAIELYEEIINTYAIPANEAEEGFSLDDIVRFEIMFNRMTMYNN